MIRHSVTWKTAQLLAQDVRADRTRERMWRELEDEHTIGTDAHVPELRFGEFSPELPDAGSPEPNENSA